ncbi:MAG: hypothetical protein ACK4F7_00130 [Inhella sp.]
MKSFKKVALAAAVAAVAAGNAFAAANIDANTGSGGVYAAERNLTAATSHAVGAAADQVATVTFGASLATDAVAYVRFDLPAGKTFTANPTFAVNDSAGAANVNVAQGGAGQSFVIFSVAPALGENLVGGNTGIFTGAGITTANKDAISLKYRLFETLTNAANESLPLKTATRSEFVTFANAIAITAGTALTATANVSADTGAYTKFTGPSTEKPVVSFTVAHTARALQSGAASVVTDVLANTNAVTVTGDFTAAGGVTLDTSSTCAGAGVAGTLAGDKQSVTFSGLSAADITSAQWYVCYSVNMTNAIAISDYSGSIDLVGQTNYTPADGDTGTGSIDRNGTILKGAIGNVNETLSGSVHLTNTSSSAATFDASCLTFSGRQAGLTARSLPANSARRFNVFGSSGDALGCPSNTIAVELTLAVPSGNVIGSVVRWNPTTGLYTFESMTGNQ